MGKDVFGVVNYINVSEKRRKQDEEEKSIKDEEEKSIKEESEEECVY